MSTAPIVSKVWSFCTRLRDDGVGYGDYLEQLTYTIFLKMTYEYAKPPLQPRCVFPRLGHLNAAFGMFASSASLPLRASAPSASPTAGASSFPWITSSCICRTQAHDLFTKCFHESPNMQLRTS